MKTVKLGLLALAATLMIGASCKKYEEGPSFSLRTKKARLVNTWTADKEVSADGDEYNYTQEEKDNNTLEINKDGSVKVTTDDGNGNAISFEGTWEFGDKKETVKFTYDFGGVSTTDEVTIIKLKNKEWASEDEDGDKTYYVAK